MRKDNSQKDYQFVIFGGTGDLTRNKLLPAFYNLSIRGLLPENISIIPIGRRYQNNEAYLRDASQFIKENTRFEFNEKTWLKLARKIDYKRLNIKNNKGFKKLKEELSDFDNGDRIFYLAVAPRYFSEIVTKLQQHELTTDFTGKSRLIIEKPFGKDLVSARELNQKIRGVFPEDDIFRIDHYLGKEMLQNISVIRFANIFFEPIWNKRYIDNIQIISQEKKGVGERARYYNEAGALRDMMQNHMLQLLTLTAMEPPGTMQTESIRNEKVKVLQNLAKFKPDNIEKFAVRGQYGSGEIDGDKVTGYQSEDTLLQNSQTETFVALKVFIDNLRWQGVPFYIKTGKRLPQKSTEIVVEFNSGAHPSYIKEFSHLQPNLLVIKIQPQEGVFLQFNAKEPGTRNKIIPVKMDFCQNCQVSTNSPEAYERLISDMIKGDPTLFTRWDEVEYSWKFIDNIASKWKNQTPDFPNYEAGSTGPEAADELLQQDGREWWHLHPKECIQMEMSNK